jgi:FtsP/CotA-like multicopper oxidase with cupredoxin domain
MTGRKFLNSTLMVLVLATLVFGSMGQGWTVARALAAPASPTDESKVPHYFGPYPNWANSPFTLPDVAVEITGDGQGATAVASVGANGAVTGITITDPGSGYTSATVNITGAGMDAAATANVTLSGIVSGITVDMPGSGYTQPVVTISGGGGTGTLMQVGNQPIARAYATDFATPPGTLGPVFVVVPATMPASGFVNEIMYFNQATTGGSPTPSAGNLFHAYVLHATGNPNEYSVLWDSGEQTVPPAVDPVGDIVTIPVPNVAVTTGDAIAFYGEGIPVDTGSGADIVSYPAPAAPVQGTLITVGDPATFPLLGEARTYSFAANVIDTSGVVPLTDATATAYGGVAGITVDIPGSSYTMPTVDFDLPDAPDGVQARAHAEFDSISGAITAVVVDNPGSGYSSAPNVVIRDGTLFDPINNGGSGATATATLAISAVSLDTFGSGYTSPPMVTISDATGFGTGAVATAKVNAGAVTGIAVTNPGTGYITTGGIKKFQDGLPKLCIPSANFSECADPNIANNLGQYIPIAVADTTTFSTANGFDLDADYYVIALVQHREQMNSSLPAQGTLLREYVQLETPANFDWSKHVALQTDLLDGTSVPTLMPDGSQAIAVDDPHFLGPVIVANKDKPVRIVFYNLLPTGEGGDLFLPTDSTIMGSGMGPTGMADPVDEGTVMDGVRNPMCSEYPKGMDCFKDNRATLHLHGGITPWISDGTPHQWITPANEMTPWPQGVSVEAVPDMNNVPGVPDCSAPEDGCMDFYYTNQQSARFMFYHDHAWGITRLNVYAGEAAGYLITDPTDQALMAAGGPLADVGLGIPLVIQDRTFVPSDAQLYGDPANGVYGQDPTWDASRWGGEGSLWYHHVYMPAQNPGDPSGMSAFGRWMYGPWFWPPATPPHGPIDNPYYDPNCNLDDPATWQYQTDPFCEPQLIPGTPNISVGMEQFNDTPIVNGTAYPTTSVDPKAYRFRILNAANDRFWNLQWYVADPSSEADPLIGPTEVALNPAELAAAQIDPNIFPTPDTTVSPAGPSWIQIGSEGGFLPAPVVVANQPITWIIDPTRFDVGNVDKHALLLAPAERADVIVDFSDYAGQTLILYNDAPAAFPARVASYDYYTGAPDLSPVGAPSILPGYGPNTRTIMQVKVAAARADGEAIATYNLAALNAAFRHHADGSGVFESGQHPIIVGQAAYNSAYGTSFASSSWCNAPGSTSTRCDGFVRISEQGGDQFGFNTLKNPTLKKTIMLQPKAIHDEMNASAFDEFGRMTANLGLEAVPATPAGQNIILYPYVNPSTELIDATNLPKGDVNVTPIGMTDDGAQIWKITHNGVDTHPIHWHLYDVQVLNRVTWDNIILPPDATELGWKDTLRVSPLEDTIVALRPIIPTLPFELPNSVRPLNPMTPIGSPMGFNNIDQNGNPTAAIVNEFVNFGWEYVFHCHILSHEEMDMMRPVSVALPPNAPDGLAWTTSGNGNNTQLTLTWNDNSINETEFVVQRDDGTGNWVDLATILQPLHQPDPTDPINKGPRSYTDTTFRWNATTYSYRVVARNIVGYGGAFMSLTVQSVSAAVAAIQAPSNLTAALLTGPQVSLAWTDNATNETGFSVERSTDGVNFVQVGPAPARNNTGSVTYVDPTPVQLGATYTYRVAAVNAMGASAYSNVASVVVAPPTAPAGLSATVARQGNNERVTLTWTDVATNEAGYTVQRSADPTFAAGVTTNTLAANATTYTTGNITRTTWYFRVSAFNAIGASAWATVTVQPAP